MVQESLDDWTGMFPSINVLIELKRMKAYLDAHPNKKRKAHEMENFVLRWLSKEQDQKLSFPKQTKTDVKRAGPKTELPQADKNRTNQVGSARLVSKPKRDTTQRQHKKRTCKKNGKTEREREEK